MTLNWKVYSALGAAWWCGTLAGCIQSEPAQSAAPARPAALQAAVGGADSVAVAEAAAPATKPAPAKTAPAKPAAKPAPAKPGTKPAATKPTPAKPADATVLEDGDTEDYDPTVATLKRIALRDVKPHDWPQAGGSPLRNNTPEGKNIPTEWDVATGENVRWTAQLGSQTYGNPVVANGQVYVGTNNGFGYVKRYPARVDLGCLICFKEETGEFLWQHSNEKLPTGRVHDWPLQGVCVAPLVDGERLWFVSNRGEVLCLDTQGFRDGENDGPYQTEKEDATKDKKDVIWEEEKEADVIWKYNMMDELQVSQHNMCSCSVTAYNDWLFVNTSNGVDEAHITIPQPSSPSFMCMDRNTGKVLWTDNSPGANVLHGQWSSPAFAVIDGQAQVMFAGGDGWLYSFDPAGENGKSKLLWKFDCNPKESVYTLSRATRNHLIGTPVIYKGKVFIGVGEDPEHGEGGGHLWCIDATRRGDVSPELVFNSKNPDTPIAHKRLQAAVEREGDFTRPNPNTAAVWHYATYDANGDGKIKFEETMHRTMGTVAIKDDLLFVADMSGLVHCVDAARGVPYWTHDMLAASWGSPLIVEGKVILGDEDGDVTIFELSKTLNVVAEISMRNSVYTTPIIANDTLFISNKDQLFSIQTGAKSDPPKPRAASEDAGSDE